MTDALLGEGSFGGRVAPSFTSSTTGWHCPRCNTSVDIATPLPFRCPNATPDDPHHVLQIVRRPGPIRTTGIRQTFANFDAELAWSAYAAANGMDQLTRLSLVLSLDDAVRAVCGVGFNPTPFERSDALSDEFGFEPHGGVWVKDETAGVAGSQKARFLFSILLHLRAAEALGHLSDRPPLAIASCGNAALAAATLARAARWPIEVYVPVWMGAATEKGLTDLGATVHRCERRATDPPGDPAMHRFRDAIAGGAIPFTVQGPENALCLDGGRTLGWEICQQGSAQGVERFDRLYVQVGGGAFAAAVGAAVESLCGPVPLRAVQTEGCAPLARAWGRADGVTDLANHWGDLMTVWDNPTSVADGILDDETYDWIGVFDAMRTSGGAPLVAPEPLVIEAHAMAHRAGFDVSATGSAGLAGLLTERDSVAPSERVVVVMSGVTR